jgi:hypothetical protein
MANKLVIVRLADITYAGESIGDDLTLISNLGARLITVNKKLSVGQTARLNISVGTFVTSASSFQLAGVLTVVERDPIFNDSGAQSVNFNIDTRSAGTQTHAVQISVVESGGLFDPGIAEFEITIEAVVALTSRFVPDQGDGWLAVLMEDDRSRVSRPAALRVEVERVSSDREYFTVGEGPYRGRHASIKLSQDGTSRLSSDNPQTSAVRLTYSISKKTLSLGRKKYLTKDYPSKPWSKGLYDIEIPDAPHAGGLSYTDVTRAKTWFRVGHTGDRFIHTGRQSLGCMTVVERELWDELCAVIVRSRKGDGISVGTVEVVD